MDNSESSQNSILTKKINKILESDLDNDRETREALKGLSAFFTDNNLNARRNLRNDIEKRNLALNEEFLCSYGEVKRVLDSLYSDALAMSECCQQMSTLLENTKTQTAGVFNRISELRNQT